MNLKPFEIVLLIRKINKVADINPSEAGFEDYLNDTTHLTKNQIRLVKLIADGYTNKEIYKLEKTKTERPITARITRLFVKFRTKGKSNTRIRLIRWYFQKLYQFKIDLINYEKLEKATKLLPHPNSPMFREVSVTKLNRNTKKYHKNQSSSLNQ